MSYSEILDVNDRLKAQFEPHAVLALGRGTVANAATNVAIVLPAFSCVATDLVFISNFTSTAAQATGNALRSAIIAVDGAGIPTLTVTLGAANAGVDILFNYFIYRAAN
jgi:hypothetical protein